MKLHGGPNLARGPEFDTHGILQLKTNIFADRIFTITIQFCIALVHPGMLSKTKQWGVAKYRLS